MSELTVKILSDADDHPQRRFLADYNVAFGKADTAFILDCVSDDVTWEIHGDRRVQGKEAFRAFIMDMVDYKISEIIIRRIIVQGKEGAVNGEVVMADGKRYAFADIYEFTAVGQPTLRSMASYVHEVVF